MIRYLLIVGRQRRDLHEYLAQQFAGDDSIRIVMERRSAERRRRQGRPELERRQRERRAGSLDQHGLACHGLLVLRPSAAQASEPPSLASQILEGSPPPGQGLGAVVPGVKSSTEAARRWIGEGRRHLSVLQTLLGEQGYLEGRLEALEEKFASLDETIRRLSDIRVPEDGSMLRAPSPDSPPGLDQDNPDRPMQR